MKLVVVSWRGNNWLLTGNGITSQWPITGIAIETTMDDVIAVLLPDHYYGIIVAMIPMMTVPSVLGKLHCITGDLRGNWYHWYIGNDTTHYVYSGWWYWLLICVIDAIDCCGLLLLFVVVFYRWRYIDCYWLFPLIPILLPVIVELHYCDYDRLGCATVTPLVTRRLPIQYLNYDGRPDLGSIGDWPWWPLKWGKFVPVLIQLVLTTWYYRWRLFYSIYYWRFCWYWFLTWRMYYYGNERDLTEKWPDEAFIMVHWLVFIGGYWPANTGYCVPMIQWINEEMTWLWLVYHYCNGSWRGCSRLLRYWFSLAVILCASIIDYYVRSDC